MKAAARLQDDVERPLVVVEPIHSGAFENRAETPCDPPVTSEKRFASGTPTIGSAIVTMAIASPPRRAAASAMSSPTTAGMRGRDEDEDDVPVVGTPYAVTYAPSPRKKI